jgi:ketosteroid isomerase-like protein
MLDGDRTSESQEIDSMLPQAIHALVEAINSHDPERIAAYFTDDYVAEVPQRPSEGFIGSGQVAANWRKILASCATPRTATSCGRSGSTGAPPRPGRRSCCAAP